MMPSVLLLDNVTSPLVVFYCYRLQRIGSHRSREITRGLGGVSEESCPVEEALLRQCLREIL